MRSKLALMSLALVGLVSAASPEHFELYGGAQKIVKSSRQVNKGHFGATEIVEVSTLEDGTSKITKDVYPSGKHFTRDYERQTRALNMAVHQDRVNRERIREEKIFTCDNRGNVNPYGPDDAGFFIPVNVGPLNADQSSITYTNGKCFKNIKFSFGEALSADESTGDVTITVDTEGSSSLFCSDWFFFATTSLQHVETFYLSGNHEVTFKNLTSDTLNEIREEGLRVYMFCDGYADTFLSVYNTALAFVGGLGTDPNVPIYGSHVPDYMEDANVKFLSSLMGYNLTMRETQDYIDLYDESLIQSGDFISITRLDGVDPIIMYGSGSHAGHSVLALRFDGELYIIESQDGWYWPNHGIQRNKWSDWKNWAKNADFHVSHMPLSPEARARFNETAAQEFFFKTDGLPYGYHNFLFGWIDTPLENWPPLLPPGFMPILFSILEDFIPDTVDIFFSQALNKRLGTEGLNVKQIAGEAGRRNLTVEDLMAEIEVEGWVYKGLQPRDGVSYVCSAYVAAAYQAAGMFAPGVINGPEFTPRDIYTMDIFDKNFVRPEVCVKADPDQPYCQILGKYRMTHPGYSSVKLYDHMAERCPSIAPDYVRLDGC